MAFRFSGWDTYPENIRCEKLCCSICDRSQYRDELVKDANRLFCEERVDLQVIEIGRNDRVFSSAPDLEEYLEENDMFDDVIRVFLVPQEYSWGRLCVTFDVMRKLLTSNLVGPQFLDILRNFGQRTGASNDSCRTSSLHRHGDKSDVLETSFIAWHVEEHERQREEPKNLWSFRQMGVHHRQREGGNSSFIILNPSRKFCRRLKQLNQTKRLSTASDVQAVLLSCTTQQWKWYQLDLEERVTAAKRKAHLAETTEASLRLRSHTQQDLRVDDVQDLQVLYDHAIRLCQKLDSNFDVLELVHSLQPVAEASSGAEVIDSLLRQMKEEIKRASVTRDQIQAALSLVQTLLDLRGLDNSNRFLQKLELSAEAMNEMTLASQKESQAILELSRKASHDQDILKAITFLGLIYLPASFAASVMEMNNITVTESNGVTKLLFSSGFYVFLVMTAIFWVITFGGYYVWRLYKTKVSNKGR